VLAWAKALRFAPTRSGVGFACLDPGCARPEGTERATADGHCAGLQVRASAASSGTRWMRRGSGGLGQQGGLPPSGRHNWVRVANHPGGLVGQMEPVEPVSVLDPDGGGHAVSWHRCSRSIKRLVSARSRDRCSGSRVVPSGGISGPSGLSDVATSRCRSSGDGQAGTGDHSSAHNGRYSV